MTLALAASGPTPLWYTSRGAGAAALVLLTLSVALGIVDQLRWRPAGWPRFVLDALHRNVSLLALVVLVVHVTTSVLDSFAPIGLKDVVIPFVASYRPLWLGLGAVAFDLMLAVLITSLLRRQLGHRAWRATHWLAYASWPVAVLHGLGTGTDTKFGWMLALTFSCIALVLAAALVRVVAGTEPGSGWRTAALAALIAAPIGLVAWLPHGPLGKGWARKAGTPSALLSGAKLQLAAAKSSAGATLAAPFQARLSGRLRRGQSPQGQAIIDLAMHFRGQASGALDVRLEGQPVQGGGVQMTRSQVTLGPPSNPAAYRGRVRSLAGERVVAAATDSSGRSLLLNLTLSVDQASQTVGGTISATPAPGSSR